MSVVGICAIAFNQGERYDSFHTPPEVANFIEYGSIWPAKTRAGYSDDRKYFWIDTGHNCGVKAVLNVSLHQGQSNILLPFSQWLYWPDPNSDMMVIPDQEMQFREGDCGIVGLYFGLKRPAIRWPGFEIKDIHRWVHMLPSQPPVGMIIQPSTVREERPPLTKTQKA